MTPPTRGRAAGWLLVVFAVAQIAMTLAIQVFGGRSPGGRGAELWISPAPYAFGIWGIIYLLCLVHAVAAVRHGTGVADQSALVVPLSTLYVAAALWSIAFSAGSAWLTFVVLAVMVAAAVRALLVVINYRRREGVPDWMVRLERLTVGLYAGWATIAVFINFASAVADQGLAEAASVGWQWAVLAVALVALLALLWASRGALGVAVAAIWALVGVLVAVGTDSTLLAVLCALGIIAVAAVWMSIAYRDRRRAAGRGWSSS